MNFFIGQRVICVDAGMSDKRFVQDMSGLIEGGAYTVRWIGRPARAFASRFPDQANILLVGLDEIIRPSIPGGGQESGFNARRFRPATDISSFMRMLVTKAEPQDLLPI